MEVPSSPIPPVYVPPPQQHKAKHFSAVLLIGLILIGLVAGGLIGYGLSYSTLNGKIDNLQTQLQGIYQNAAYTLYSNSTYLLSGNVSLAQLYRQVQQSVVVVQDLVPQYNFFGFIVGYAQQQGSGFVTIVNGKQVIVTNNHVMQGANNATVTFADGSSYPATEVGSDANADLAVLTVNDMPSGVPSLTIVTSATLQVGDPVVAVGSPYGLSGTLTTGVVSALGRTITESDNSNTGPTIADIIQTSTAINPGNSGGPLINYAGEVVGITTAAVSDSQGLGFAIPSETLLRELNALLTNGSYDQHPSIGVTGTDMNYQVARAIGTNITYGFLVEHVSTQNGLKGGSTQAAAGSARVVIGGDIIIAINGARIANGDAMLSYLEQHTLPGQSIDFTVIRDNQIQDISVTIGKLT